MPITFKEEYLDMTINNDKKILRKRILKLRDELDSKYREDSSQKIFNELSKLKEFKNAETVMTFVSFSTEVDTKLFIEKCWSLGKRIITPLAKMKSKELEIYEINNWEQLQPGVYDILEPIPDKKRLVDPIEIDFVINPGVAFDINLNRIGYGGGFYDRFYHRLSKNCIRVAVGFDTQIVDKVPVDEYDVPVDMLITENRIIKK